MNVMDSEKTNTMTKDTAAASKKESIRSKVRLVTILLATTSMASNAEGRSLHRQDPNERSLQNSACDSATIKLDGDLRDWAFIERLHPASWEKEGTNGAAYEFYGTYDSTCEMYFLGLKHNGAIGPGTTFWLNTDQDVSTGHQIFGENNFGIGGAEFNINVYTDGKPYLYTGAAAQNYITGPLDHAFNSDKSIVEIGVPASRLFGIGVIRDIDVLIDVNDAVFLPEDYDGLPPYTIRSRTLPPRTDKSTKQVGVVFSQATVPNFFDEKAYAQLYASMQHQLMMAGIPYKLLYLHDLKSLTNLVNFDALIFPYNANVNAADLEAIVANLHDAVYHYGISIITAGNWLTNDENDAPLLIPYERMNRLLGVGRVAGGEAPLTLKVATSNHPVMRGYTDDETILRYDNKMYYSYFAPPANGNAQVSTLAHLVVDGDPEIRNAILASETAGAGARHVHFSFIAIMGDSNVVWQAVQWAVFGNDNCNIGLKLGRYNSIFLSRNDMDQSMFLDEIEMTHVVLYDDYLIPWKESYNFVGTYFINIGNSIPQGEYTDWTVSKPLYENYMAIGNEIGSHSYTHPHFINTLSDEQLKFEFDNAQKDIAGNLSLPELGTAQPGAPENLRVATFLDNFLPYFSGGYSGVGAGYPGAFGYLSPDFQMTYFAPNLLFDFTTTRWLKLTPPEALLLWNEQYDAIMNHASTPLVHWPWHDYGPTGTEPGFNSEMFEEFIKRCADDGTEFVTTMDMHHRIKSWLNSNLSVREVGNSRTVHVASSDAGRFALDVGCGDSQIRSVEGWYAYTSNKVFLPAAGGTFKIALGEDTDDVTRITDLPMRSELVELDGDGIVLDFVIYGEGSVTVELNSAYAADLDASGADECSISEATMTLKFRSNGPHKVSITQNPAKHNCRLPQFVENGIHEYEFGLNSENSCVTLLDRKYNSDACDYFMYNQDLVCPREGDSYEPHDIKFRLRQSLTCLDGWNKEKLWYHVSYTREGKNYCKTLNLGCEFKDDLWKPEHEDFDKATCADNEYIEAEVFFYPFPVDDKNNLPIVSNCDVVGKDLSTTEAGLSSTTGGYCYFKYQISCKCEENTCNGDQYIDNSSNKPEKSLIATTISTPTTLPQFIENDWFDEWDYGEYEFGLKSSCVTLIDWKYNSDACDAFLSMYSQDLVCPREGDYDEPYDIKFYLRQSLTCLDGWNKEKFWYHVSYTREGKNYCKTLNKFCELKYDVWEPEHEEFDKATCVENKYIEAEVFFYPFAVDDKNNLPVVSNCDVVGEDLSTTDVGLDRDTGGYCYFKYQISCKCQEHTCW